MEYVKLGGTGLEVSRLCLGCLSFGAETAGAKAWAIDEESSRACVRRAVEMGINFFDTANRYSGGGSEEVLGRALKEYAVRDEVVIATKVFGPVPSGPNRSGLSRKAIMAQAEDSLRRLGTDHIDLYQVHRWDPLTPIEETLEALDDLVRVGKVGYVGASSMFAWQFCKMLYTSDLHGWSRFVSMQNHYNLLYREEEREMVPLCEDQRVGVLPWSPLARGALARSPERQTVRSSSDDHGRSLYGAGPDRIIIDRVAAAAEIRSAPMAQVALAWLLAQPSVTAPIVGVTAVEHVNDAVAALQVRLTSDEIRRFETPYRDRSVAGMS